MPQNIYLFTGLGADERVFRRLDWSGHEVIHIQWLIPLVNESIEEYAARLLPQIKDENPIFLGVSFGGMMAVEVAKLITVQKIILISSLKTNHELPWYYRWAGRLRVHRIIPHQFLRHSNCMTNWFFGAKSPEDKDLLKIILAETDPTLLRWSLKCIVSWSNTHLHPNLLHIHGTQDKILPLRYVQADRQVKGGGHLMVLNFAEEMSAILREVM